MAGTFYPGDAELLRATVHRLVDAVELPPGEPLAAAYVVPHAGYQYSGPVAAHVYARLRTHAEELERVVLLGPAHFVRLAGCALSTMDEWLTPLGAVPLDTAARDALLDASDAVADDAPHEPEHSLEVQLPFLQGLPAVPPIVPIVVGSSTVDEVARVLAAAATPDTVVLCSTDLSHYHDHPTAQRLDRRTVDAVLDLDPDRIGPRDACGVYALRGLVGWAARTGLRPRLLDRRTSTDTGGEPSRVVGYAALAFDVA